MKLKNIIITILLLLTSFIAKGITMSQYNYQNLLPLTSGTILSIDTDLSIYYDSSMHLIGFKNTSLLSMGINYYGFRWGENVILAPFTHNNGDQELNNFITPTSVCYPSNGSGCSGFVALQHQNDKMLIEDATIISATHIYNFQYILKNVGNNRMALLLSGDSFLSV